MLTKPKCGWTNIVIGNNVLPASYLTDVPIDCLDSLTNTHGQDYGVV